MFYPIEIVETNGGFRAFSRDLPELAVGFDTFEELHEKLRAFVPYVMETMYRREKRRIPMPSNPKAGERCIYVPLYIQAKVALWNCMIDKGMNLQALAEMLGISATQAQRYVDLSVKKVSLESIEEALYRLGAHLTVKVDPVA